MIFKNNQKNDQENYQKSVKTIKKQSKIYQNNQKLTQKLKNGGPARPFEPRPAPIFEFLCLFLIVLIDF